MEIHVAFSSDENYVPFLATAIISIMEKEAIDKPFLVHLTPSFIRRQWENKILN